MNNTTRTVTVPAAYVESARKALARLNRSAERHGLAIRSEITAVSAPREQVALHTVRERGEFTGLTSSYVVEVVDLTVSLPAAPVRRDGWSLGAIAEATDSGLDLTVVDERVRPVASRISSASFECAHCRARRNRAKVIVAVDAAGAHVLLGTECAKAYISEIDNDLFTLEFCAATETVIDSEGREFDGEGGKRSRAWPLEQVLAAAIESINARGYSARWVQDQFGERSENLTCTRHHVVAILSRTQTTHDVHAAEAADTAAWLLALDPAAQHDAVRSAIDAASIGLVSEKKLGAVCWAVQARRNEISKAAAEAAKRAAGADKNLAPEGRVAITGRVLKTKKIDNGFGLQTKLLVEIATPAANAFTRVYVSAPSILSGAIAGDEVAFTATFSRAPDDDKFAFGSRPTVKKAKA